VSQFGTINLDVADGVTLPHLTSRTRLREWLATGMLAALVFASFATALTISGTLIGYDTGATPKVYHLLLALAGVPVVMRGRVLRPSRAMLLYFSVMAASTVLAYLAFEARPAGLKLIIAFYTAIVAAEIGRSMGTATVLRACRLAGALFLAVVTVKNAVNVQAFILWLASPLGHPDVPSLAGGGLNLEATWLAVASAFFIGSVWFIPFVLGAAATSALYASRAGVVIAALIVLAAVLRAFARGTSAAEPQTGHPALRRAVWVIMALAAMALLTAGTIRARQYGNTAYVAQRFSTIGEEPGSLGRVTLWRGGLRVFAEHPLGVGTGNAVPVLRRLIGVDVPEDNLHNMYLQHAVEAGIPGLAVLIAFGLVVAGRLFRSRFGDQLLLFVAAYLVAGAIQFTGVDAVLWLVYGLQWGTSLGGQSA
jgi:O-antigen ligase